MALDPTEIQRLIDSGQLSPELGRQLAEREGMRAASVSMPYVNQPKAGFERTPTQLEAESPVSQAATAAEGVLGKEWPEIAVKQPIQPGQVPQGEGDWVEAGKQTPREQPAIDPASLARPGAPPPPAAPAPRAPMAGGGGGGSSGSSLATLYQDQARRNLGLINEQERNVAHQRDFDMQQAAQQASQMQRDQEALEAADAQRQAEHAQRSQRAQAALDDLNARSAALASYKEDPNRVWKDDGQKMTAGLGLLVAAIGQGTSGSKTNAAFDTMQRIQDQDIEAQRAEYHAKRDSVAAQNSAFGRMMELYHDEDSSATALRALQIDTASRKLQLMAAGSQSEAVRLRADQAVTALNAQRAQLANQFAAQQYQLAHPPGGATAGMPKVLKDLYGDRAAGVFAQKMAEAKAAGKPYSYEQFVSEAVQASGGKYGGEGSGKGSPRLQAGMVRVGTAQTGLDQAAEARGMMWNPRTERYEPPGWQQNWLGARVEQGLNYLGDVASSQGSGERHATVETAAPEIAAALAGGTATDTGTARAEKELDTNDPRRFAAQLTAKRRSLEKQKQGLEEFVRNPGPGNADSWEGESR